MDTYRTLAQVVQEGNFGRLLHTRRREVLLNIQRTWRKAGQAVQLKEEEVLVERNAAGNRMNAHRADRHNRRGGFSCRLLK